MKRIAFFDFDGTITSRNTLLEIIRHQRGLGRFYSGFAAQIPFYIAFKLKFISNQQAKENILSYFFKGTPVDSFQEKCDAYAGTRLPAILRRGAVDEITRLQNEGFEVVVVSASAENWIRKWADEQGISVIATRLESFNGKLTGKIDGLNCNGGEKVARIKLAYDLSTYDEIYAYGDTKGDKPMLALATRAHYKPFRR